MSITKRFTSYSLFSVATSFIAFVTVPYLTRVLEPEEFGVVGIYLSILYFVQPLISWQAEGLVGINKVDIDQCNYRRFINTYLSLGILSFFLVSILAVIFSFIYFEYYLLVILIPAVGLIQFLGRAHSVELIQDKDPLHYGVYTLGVSVLALMLTLFCVSLLDMAWEGRLLAIMMAEIIVLYFRWRLTFKSLRNFSFSIDRKYYSDIAHYGAPLVIMLGAAWLLNESDRFIVLYFFSLSDVGLYTAAYSIGMALNVINNAMINALTPNVYQMIKSGKGRKRIKVFDIGYSLAILVLSVILAQLFYMYGGVVLGEKYQGGAIITSIVIVAFGFSGAYRILGLVLEYKRMNALRMKVMYFTALVNIVVSVALIGAIGVLAPAVGTLVSYAVLSIITAYYSMKELDRTME